MANNFLTVGVRILASVGLYKQSVFISNSSMDESDFEGTLVLEKLAEIDKLDDFFEAIDSDDFAKAQALMKRAKIDSNTIAIVLKKMSDADGEH